MDEEIDNEIISSINSRIGAKLTDENLNLLVEFYSSRLLTFEGQLDETSGSSSIFPLLKGLIDCSERNQSGIADLEDFLEKLETKLSVNQEIFHDIESDFLTIVQLQHAVEYFKIIRSIQDISNDLKVKLRSTDEKQILELYLVLYRNTTVAENLLGSASHDPSTPHLKQFVRETVIYWHNTLLAKFSLEFEKSLKQLKWPQLDLWIPTTDAAIRLKTLAQYLFMVKVPETDDEQNVKITPYVVCAPVSAPIEILLKAYRERFVYHFTGKRETNRLDKPEWYFTQILSWAGERHLFVQEHFQEAAVRAGVEEVDVRMEFVEGLVQLALQKLATDIETIARDEALFSHLIDEVLFFEHELQGLVGGRVTFPSAISILSQPKFIAKWTSVEESFAMEKMDGFFTGEAPWEYLDPTNAFRLKIPRCADQFIRLLDAIKERSCCLPQPAHKILFLELQLALIDNFHRRLIQLYDSAAETTIRCILNAVNYLVFVLREWAENTHYLHLLVALHGPANADAVSVFDAAIDQLDRFQKRLLRTLGGRVLDDVKAKSRPYRHDAWHAARDIKPEHLALSATAGDMFQLLVTILHELDEDLSENLFAALLRDLAKQLDDFFVDSLVMISRFSAAGAGQFQFDMQRNLLVLFGSHARTGAPMFRGVRDACALLTMPAGNAILLFDTLRRAQDRDAAKRTVRELKVEYLDPDKAMDVLERRMDIQRR